MGPPPGPLRRLQHLVFSGAGDEDDAAEEGLDLLPVAEAGLDDAGRQIGALLENVTAADPDVWTLFLQPDAELDDVCSLSKRLAQEGTGAQQAAAAIETISRMQNIKELLTLPEDKRSKLATSPSTWTYSSRTPVRPVEPSSRTLGGCSRCRLSSIMRAVCRCVCVRCSLHTSNPARIPKYLREK